jgi:ABC-type transporter Mla MlaB component
MPDTDGRDFTITVTFWPSQDQAMVVLAGDLDIDAWPDLTDAIGHLIAMPTSTLTVDVAAVQHVGAVLPNFLARLSQAVPATSMLTVSRPSLMARFVLAVTDMAQIAKIDDAFPA